MKYITKTYIKAAVLIVFVACVLITSRVNAQSKESNIHYLADTTVDFNGLISKFKGKIIYVDIWATWCSPCKEELMQKKDVKVFSDFALKNNIVILYLCCDNNDKNWKWFIRENKLAGYHIMTSESLLKDMHVRFSYSETVPIRLKKGFYIPRHMIINEKGSIVDSMADRQGSASVYAGLKKLLNK